VEKHGLDPERVQVDDHLSVRLACNIIRANREQYSHRFPHWLGIYRSGTRLTSERIRKNAESYDSMIRETARRIASYELDAGT
jgi:hypothetical protein